MRILYLSESMRWSGGAEQLLAMAGALRDRGHEVIIGCQEGSDLMERAQALGLPIESLRMRQDYDLPAAMRLARSLKARGIDLLHAQHSTAHAIGLMAAWLAKVPAFAVTRRVMFPLRRNLFSRLKYRSGRIDGYVAIAGPVKDILVEAGVDPERVEVIPSIVHRRPLPRSEGPGLRAELQIPGNSPLILQVGNLADFKGQDVLLAAAPDVLRRYPTAVFVFAGRDTEKLQPTVDRLGIESSVRLAGFRTDVPRFLAAADLFVMPSREEAVGTALREAMYAGVPSIGSNTGGIPDSIQHEETGLLVPVGNAPALAHAICRYLDQPEWAHAIAERGRRKVETEFSIGVAAGKMEHFYERLLLAREAKAG